MQKRVFLCQQVAKAKTQQSSKKIIHPAKSKARIEVKDINIYLQEYNSVFPANADKGLSAVGFVLVLLALLGLTWIIPFPKPHFLGQYNSYFNWASFVIAFYVAYYYFKLSPMYSYIILVIMFALSYAVTELDVWHQHGGPAVWLVSIIALLVGIVSIGAAKKSGTFADALKFILYGPACILKLVLKR